jgi:hypothetical protein
VLLNPFQGVGQITQFGLNEITANLERDIPFIISPFGA